MTPFTENKKKQIEKSSFECTTLQPNQQKLLLNSIEHRNAVTISIRIPLQYVYCLSVIQRTSIPHGKTWAHVKYQQKNFRILATDATSWLTKRHNTKKRKEKTRTSKHTVPHRKCTLNMKWYRWNRKHYNALNGCARVCRERPQLHKKFTIAMRNVNSRSKRSEWTRYTASTNQTCAHRAVCGEQFAKLVYFVASIGIVRSCSPVDLLRFS